MSALAAFFSRLPTPEQHDDHIKKHGIADHRAVYDASVYLGYVLGEDDDLSEWLKSRQSRSLEYAYMFWHSVFHLATTNARINLDEDTDMAKRIRFYRWIARGRNDAEKDLLHKSTTSATLADRITACLLPPESNLGCACCGKSPPDSEKFSHCAGCAISSDCGNYKVLCTFYCSKTCQTKHWPDHKTTCIPRHKILRAGSLLQQLMKFIEITGSDVLWKRIYDNEKGITFFEQSRHGLMPFAGAAHLHVVETELKNQLPGKKAAFMAVVSAGRSTEVIHVGHVLLNQLIQPLCKKIEAVCVFPRNARTSLCILNPTYPYKPEDFMMIDKTTVLRLTLHSGEQLVLDVTCGQFGWREPVMPWGKWLERRAMSMDFEQAVSFPLVTSIVATERLIDGPERHRATESRREMAIAIAQVLATRGQIATPRRSS